MSTKSLFRQRLRATLSELTAQTVEAASRRACHRVFELEDFARAEVVMVFLSLPTEVDTSSLVLRCWRDRKRVLAPKVSWEQRRMLPVEIRSLTDDLTSTEFGLREPAAGDPVPMSMIDLIIVPGLAFDESGNRLGRGRGFYDRFLAHAEPRTVACGLVFEQQVVERLPIGPLDRPVHILVTEEKTRRFSHERPVGAVAPPGA